jgi:hypothetical protein
LEGLTLKITFSKDSSWTFHHDFVVIGTVAILGKNKKNKKESQAKN